LNAGSVASKDGNSEAAIQKYSDAITQYSEGLAADADQPALLTNKSTALKARAIERFNSAIRSKTRRPASRSEAPSVSARVEARRIRCTMRDLSWRREEMSAIFDRIFENSSRIPGIPPRKVESTLELLQHRADRSSWLTDSQWPSRLPAVGTHRPFTHRASM